MTQAVEDEIGPSNIMRRLKQQMNQNLKNYREITRHGIRSFEWIKNLTKKSGTVANVNSRGRSCPVVNLVQDSDSNNEGKTRSTSDPKHAMYVKKRYNCTLET